MEYPYKRKEIGDGIYFGFLSDEKFYHNMITVNFILPLREEMISDFAVLPEVLRNGCEKFPSLLSLNRKLADLYGARVSFSATKRGDRQVLKFGILGLKNKFAFNGENITKECAELLCECILNPLLTKENLFDEKSVELEKANLIDEIRAEINDKRSYSLNRCKEEMLKGKKAALKALGTEENAKKVTPVSLKKAYDDMLSSSQIEVMYIGGEEPKGVEEIFSEKLSKIKREVIPYEKESYEAHSGSIKEVEENMEVSQAKLVIGMKLTDEDYDKIVMPVAVDVFGGSTTSLLFTNVREKLSLCYYCAARFVKETRNVYVDCGILPENKEKAQAEILHQLDRLKSGDFTEEDLENVKKSRITALETASDIMQSTGRWYFDRVLDNDTLTFEEAIERIFKITINDIVEIAKKIEPDTVYFLNGMEGK